MFAAIKDALAKSVPVVIASRVPNGRVLGNYGWEGGGKTLVDAGAVMADDLSARKALHPSHAAVAKRSKRPERLTGCLQQIEDETKFVFLQGRSIGNELLKRTLKDTQN